MIIQEEEDYPKFRLKDKVTSEQQRFFDSQGYIHFKNFFSEERMRYVIDALMILQQRWIEADVKQVNGIPIRYGFDEKNNRMVHRFAFTSLHCEAVREIVNLPAIQSLKELLIAKDSRLAENEKDGVVVNQYINTGKSNMKQMGWHTDSLRDIFYGRRILPMLNIGISLTDSNKNHGGLKVLPGTHKQSLYNMIFRKPYYINNDSDKKEISIETESGDITVHHGHIWHRVAAAKTEGSASRRITMYIPVVCGKYSPKDESSFTPLYHKMNIFAKK